MAQGGLDLEIVCVFASLLAYFKESRVISSLGIFSDVNRRHSRRWHQLHPSTIQNRFVCCRNSWQLLCEEDHNQRDHTRRRHQSCISHINEVILC